MLRKIVLHFVGIWIVTVLFCSCTSSDNGFRLENPLPKRTVGLGIQRGNLQTEPLTVYITASALGDYTKGDNSHLSDLLTKLEVDFGGGGGWIDETAWYNVNDGTKIKHIYGEAGTYQLNVRATFWDGEVIYLGYAGEPDPPRFITVPEN